MMCAVDSPITHSIANSFKDKKTIAKNLESQAKYARLLVIWTDCDREGEHIGHEIVEAARLGNPAIQVKRAHFSNVERAYVSIVIDQVEKHLINP